MNSPYKTRRKGVEQKWETPNLWVDPIDCCIAILFTWEGSAL